MSRAVHIILWIATVSLVVFLLVRFGGPLLSPLLQETGETESVQSSPYLPLAGNEAPYFELTDLVGNRVRLSDFANTPLLVTFWAGGVSDAADQIKIFDDWRVSHPSALFTILTVNSQEDKSVVKNLIDRGGYNVPVLLDSTGEAGEVYGVVTLPTSFFIDGKGIIREVYIGIMSQKMIGDKGEQILR